MAVVKEVVSADRGIVVMAASAGGLRAVSAVIDALPANFPTPVVVVQHRSALFESHLPELLARRSPLPVEEAQGGDVVGPGKIYVARADLHLTVTHSGRFAYVDGSRIRFVLSAANPLFSSAAAVYGDQTIAVVLSGTGMDGTEGAQAVKAKGGVVIVQDQTTSEHFGMPQSVIQAGAAHFVLPLDAIAPALVELAGKRREV